MKYAINISLTIVLFYKACIPVLIGYPQLYWLSPLKSIAMLALLFVILLQVFSLGIPTIIILSLVSMILASDLNLFGVLDVFSLFVLVNLIIGSGYLYQRWVLSVLSFLVLGLLIYVVFFVLSPADLLILQVSGLNYFAGIILAIYLLNTEGFANNKMIRILSILVLLVLRSRSALVAILLSELYFNWKRTIAFLFLLFGVVTLFTPFNFSLVLNKWQESGGNGATSIAGRTEIWCHYVQHIFGNWYSYILPNSVSSFFNHSSQLGIIRGRFYMAHNLFLQFVSDYGLLIVILVLFSVMRMRFRKRVLLLTLVFGFFEPSFYVTANLISILFWSSIFENEYKYSYN